MKLVLIEWIDSHHQTGWVCEVPEAKVMHCRSVGWVVAENEEALVLAANVADGQHCGEMTIPKCSIRETTGIMKKNKQPTMDKARAFAIFESHMNAIETWHGKKLGHFCNALATIHCRPEVPNDVKSMVELALVVLSESLDEDMVLDLTLKQKI